MKKTNTLQSAVLDRVQLERPTEILSAHLLLERLRRDPRMKFQSMGSLWLVQSDDVVLPTLMTCFA